MTSPPPGRGDALAAATGLTDALNAVSGQLQAVSGRMEAAEKTVRRGRRIITGLAVSLCLDLLITAGLGYNTIRQNDTQNGIRATQNSIRASDIRQCQLANTARGQDIAIWNRVLKVPPAEAAKATAAQRAEVADLERLVKVKDTPRDCAAAYSARK